MAQMKIRWESQIMDLSIWWLQIKDADIALSKLVEWADLMKKSQNLWDLADAAISRTNLWLWDVAVLNAWIAAWNVPVLDWNWKLLEWVMPSLSITEVFPVADIAERDTLTVQSWDVAVVADNGSGVTETFIYDWTAFVSMKSFDWVTSVNWLSWDVIIWIAEIAWLQTALDDKLDDSQLSTNSSLWTDDTLVPSQAAVKSYVDSAVTWASTRAIWEELVVTNGSWELWDTANVPTAWTVAVFVNWNREFDFTLSWSTITLWFTLKDVPWFSDKAHVDYNY